MQTQILSVREKLLAIVAGVLLLVLAVVGYAKAQSVGTSTPAPTSTATPHQIPGTSEADRERDKKNQQNHIKGQYDTVKNWHREIQDIKRELKNLNTATVENLVNQYENCLKTREADIGKENFWESNRQCEDFRKTTDDEWNDKLRPQQNFHFAKKNFEERKRERKNLDSQMKDLLRNDKTVDVSKLQGYLAQIDQILAKADQLATQSATRDVIDQLNDLLRTVNDPFRDFYDIWNEINQKANEGRRKSENQKDFEKNILRQCEKEIGREMKNAERDYEKFKKGGVLPVNGEENFKKLKEIYNQICVTHIGLMKDALVKGDTDAFESARNDFHNLNRDFWDIKNDFQNVANIQQQLKDVLRELKHPERELIRMKKEYERIQKKSGEDPLVKKIIDQYEATFNKAKEAVKTDPQSWWHEYQQDLNELQHDFGNIQQRVQFRVEGTRWLKDLEREVNFREKDLKNIKRDADAATVKLLEEIFVKMKNALVKAKELLATDPDAAHDLLRDFEDLRSQWNETTSDFWQNKNAIVEWDQIKRGLTMAEKSLQELLRFGKITKEQAIICSAFVEEAKGILSSKPSPEAFEKLGGLEQKARRDCPFFDEAGPPLDREYFEEFFDEHFRDAEFDKRIGADIMERVSGNIVNKVLTKLLSDQNFQNLLNVAGEKYKKEVATTLESAASLYTSESAQRDLVAKKTELLELTKQLEVVQSQLKTAQKEVQALQREIASYNFYGNAGDRFRQEIEEFIAQAPQLNKDEVQKRVKELEGKKSEAIRDSKQAKFEANIIPFLDTDDNDWFTKFVAPLAKLGVVAGKGEGRFDPGAQVTIVEALTMTFRISGASEIDEDSKLCNGKFKGHWGNKFIRWAEARGLSIVKACTDVNRPALRWELAQILLETATKDVLPETDKECFGDVKPSDKKVNAAVCKAQEAGVLKGSDGKSNAYGKLNRGEAATMVKQAAEKLFGMKFEFEPSNGKRENGGLPSIQAPQSNMRSRTEAR